MQSLTIRLSFFGLGIIPQSGNFPSNPPSPSCFSNPGKFSRNASQPSHVTQYSYPHRTNWPELWAGKCAILHQSCTWAGARDKTGVYSVRNGDNSGRKAVM